MFQGGSQSALLALALNRHAHDIGRSLQKGDVLIREITFRGAVYLQHTVRRAVSLQNHVDGAAHAMACQQVGRAEALLVL